MKELCQILGLFHEAAPRVLPARASAHGVGSAIARATVTSREDELIKLLVDMRMEARKTKNFAMADQIRQRLAQLQITLEDRPGGTVWRKE